MSKQPDSWDEALLAAGLVNPKSGEPSLNQLAIKAGLPASTVTATASGRRLPKASTIQKIADALGIDVRVVAGWVGQERTERTPYAPPTEADLLTDRQRRAVDEIIRAIVAERASTRDDNHERSRRPTSAGGSAVARPPQPDGITPAADAATPDTSRGVHDAGANAQLQEGTYANDRPWEQDEYWLAAKRGRNRGREARQQQDRDAEDGGA